MTNEILTISDVPELLKIAESATREAGSYLLERLGQAKVKHTKGYKDELLDVDLGSERIILAQLQKEAPHVGILSEEAGIIGRQDQYWTIDPVDGSANFQHGSPLFAISIALVVNQTTLGGVVYIPTRDELFTAICGQGAYLNGRRIHVSDNASLQKALVYAGDLSSARDPQIVEQGLKIFAKLFAHVHRTRILGTTVTELAYLACGRADAFVSRTANPWDVEAGRLLLAESGGKTTVITNNANKPLFIYSNGLIQEELNLLLIS
ncbi:inositol monophosphatase family protein [Ktedonobacter racemifer]|uniref:Inositol monophosphatase n=1 Tax=Ktedonobacter racemifer DSM 44963 TaxID=485913 RepID=D6U266_KTERA|nr:inositol monophosphatase [Ktedonobacter racemifer]EFH82734.1 inositol monophosphatase [Ktedonobacter racemifer DSM 44963]